MRCHGRSTILLLNALNSLSLARSDEFSCEKDKSNGMERADADLYQFVTRPDLRAPIFNVSIYDKQKAGPGLLFVAPYAEIDGNRPQKEHRTAQIGPHIYDMQGELVWSGAALFYNRPTFDFRPAIIDGKTHLSFTQTMWPDECIFPRGAGVVLDDSYELAYNVTFEGNSVVDLHEFKIIDNGRSALMLGQSTIPVGNDELSPQDLRGPRRDHAVREVDLRTGETLFEWWTTEAISDSTVGYPEHEQDDWDFMHPNSVEKTQSGDYLVSARHTDTIYLISGKDKSILWRLGGKNSSFDQGSLVFSRQHDARIQSESAEGMVISFLDNAFAGLPENPSTANVSLVVVVSLDTSTMTATLLERTPEPDGKLVTHAGNAQFLEDGNRFIDWVEGGHITEHSPTGEVVYEAKWLTERYGSYRAYKGDFVAQPKELPVMKSFASAMRNGKLATTVYVSWNGATEVRSWRVRNAQGSIVGETTKTGFETVVVCHGFHSTVSVEALDSRGEILSRSDLQTTELPLSWNSSSESGQAHSILLSICSLVMAFLVGALCREAFSRWFRKDSLHNILHSSRLGYSKVEQTNNSQAEFD